MHFNQTLSYFLTSTRFIFGSHCTVSHDLDKTPLKLKSTNAFGYWWTSFGRWCMTWNLSLAPFRALKMPKKGLKTTKKCLFGYSEASYVTQIHFFLQYASSYVSWKCIRCKIHHIGALNHPRSPLGTFWTLKTAHFGPLEQLTSFKVFYQIKSFFYSKCIKVRPINMNFILKVP